MDDSSLISVAKDGSFDSRVVCKELTNKDGVSKNLRIHKLDSIRGIAAFAVLIGHCVGSYDWKRPLPDGVASLEEIVIALVSVLWDGSSAVVVFFILSGYVLSLNYYSNRQPPYTEFLIKRTCRIYLPFVVVVLLAAAVVSQIPHVAPADTTKEFMKFWDSPIHFNAIIHNLAMTGAYNVIDPPVWSLIEEMRISIIFPLLIWLIKRFSWLIALCIAMVFSIACSRFASMDVPYWIASLGGTSRFVVLFVVGAILAKNRQEIANFYHWLPRPRRIGITLLAFILYLIRFTHLPLNLSGYIPWIGITLFFVIAANSSTADGLLTNKVLLFLGRISYSLYLLHVPVLVVTCTQIDFVPVAIRLSMVPFFSIIVASAAFFLVEQPCMNLGSWLTRRRAI